VNGEVGNYLETSIIRVLVVDDHEPFRRFACSTLGKMGNLQIVGEASDGLEAVRKAEELRPDLVVLDIGLPTLHGIEVARRIRKLCSECRILFMSQESSADLAQEVFSLGALGYVVKAYAGSELLTAVKAVCQGTKFVSKGLSGLNWTDAAGRQAPVGLLQPEVKLPPASKSATSTHCHEVQFYSDDAAFVLGFSRFIEAALKAGNPVIVIATKPHQATLLQKLLSSGAEIAASIEQGLYLPLDVADALAAFMVNDLPDPVRLQKLMGDQIALASEATKAKHPRIAACDEIAPELWAQGSADAAIQVEHVTDEIARTCNVDILCGYVLNRFQHEQESHIYERICAEHVTVCTQ
jgi:DNA-binding response OmpR family regulator